MGWYEATIRGSYATANLNGHQRFNEGRIILFHEYTHFLLSHNEGYIYPHWYREGLAEYYSTVITDTDGDLLIGTPMDSNLWNLTNEQFKLERLFRESSLRQLEPLSYAQAWLTVHYFSSSPHYNELMDYLTFYDDVLQVISSLLSTQADDTNFRNPD